jgi:uncharacterized membrane protein YccC
MDLTSTLRSLLRDLLRFDRSQMQLVTALRNAIGVLLPLAIGAATGYLLTGFTISLGALNIAFSDRPGPYRLRIMRMLLAGLSGALSVFVGSAVGATGWLTVILAALWGFGFGLLVMFGPAATQIGLTGIVLFVVYSGYPFPPLHALNQAGLILIGGALQALLAIAAWPVRRLGPERDALATVFRRLSTYAHQPPGEDASPPVTGEITVASTTLVGLGSDHSAAGESLRALLDEAERIRLELVALNTARSLLPSDGDHRTGVQSIDALMDGAGDVLDDLASMIAPGRSGNGAGIERVEAAAQPMRRMASIEMSDIPLWQRREIIAHVDALLGQLRASVELAEGGSPQGEEATEEAERKLPPELRLRDSLAILRANLTPRSASFRHALRLAVCLALATALGRALALPRPYWIPMTAAIVLKPDFTATFTRGLGRIGGTMLGLGLSTVLVFTLFGSLAAKITLVGLLVFIVRGLGATNFSLSATAITALVVVLLSFAGTPPETTIGERAVNTLIGGGLALALYAVWPTWERTQTPMILADMLDAYRRYVDMVMMGFLDPDHVQAGELHEARLAARLARSNAEASLDRLRHEPRRSQEEVDLADGIMASSHRFIQSAMALETGSDTHAEPIQIPALREMAGDIDIMLQGLSDALRHQRRSLDAIPDLRADQSALIAAAHIKEGEQDVGGETDYRLAAITPQTERMTNSLDTMAYLIQR